MASIQQYPLVCLLHVSYYTVSMPCSHQSAVLHAECALGQLSRGLHELTRQSRHQHWPCEDRQATLESIVQLVCGDQIGFYSVDIVSTSLSHTTSWFALRNIPFVLFYLTILYDSRTATFEYLPYIRSHQSHFITLRSSMSIFVNMLLLRLLIAVLISLHFVILMSPPPSLVR